MGAAERVSCCYFVYAYEVEYGGLMWIAETSPVQPVTANFGMEMPSW